MSKSQTFHIVMSASGGELDRKVVIVNDDENHNEKLRDALLALIEDTVIEPGDSFSVEQR